MYLLCLKAHLVVFAFIALDWIFISTFEGGKTVRCVTTICVRVAANVYQIEKDVMYLNSIYVYLVRNRKMPFQWETNSIWQFTHKTWVFSFAPLRLGKQKRRREKEKLMMSSEGKYLLKNQRSFSFLTSTCLPTRTAFGYVWENSSNSLTRLQNIWLYGLRHVALS